MTHPIEISDAEPRQAAEISALALRSKACWGYSAEFMRAFREELTVSESMIRGDDSLYFVAQQGSTLLGYYAIEIDARGEFELEALFVDPPYIGRGIGRALLEHAKRELVARGGRSLIIQGDPHAEKFYLAAGAEKIGSRESESIRGRRLPLFKIDLSAADAV